MKSKKSPDIEMICIIVAMAWRYHRMLQRMQGKKQIERDLNKSFSYT